MSDKSNTWVPDDMIISVISWLPITDEAIQEVEANFLGDNFEILLTDGKRVDSAYYITHGRTLGFTHFAIIPTPEIK